MNRPVGKAPDEYTPEQIRAAVDLFFVHGCISSERASQLLSSESAADMLAGLYRANAEGGMDKDGTQDLIQAYLNF